MPFLNTSRRAAIVYSGRSLGDLFETTVEGELMARCEQNRVSHPALGTESCTSRCVCTILPAILLITSGCATRQQIARQDRPSNVIATADAQSVLPVSYSTESSSASGQTKTPAAESPVHDADIDVDSKQDELLAQLESLASASNPAVRRLEREVQAAWAKSGYVDKLPDPTIGANVFGNPIETAAGSQRANLMIGQMIPWLERLDAKAQQAYYDAMSVQEALRAEQLKVRADVRIAWYRLFVLGKQIEINTANQNPLKSLITVATARIEAGGASEGDVKLGTLELTRLHERLVMLQQQVESTKAELNRAVGRDANHPVPIPSKLDVLLPGWSQVELRQLAEEHQPAIVAARLRTHATRWGIEISRLERRPNVALNASWFLIDDNRPASGVVDIGQDAWSLGAQISVPVWHTKYDAMENEADWKHSAAYASVDNLRVRYDAQLRDLWEQARAADQTRRLYVDTILPQARETRDIDIQSFSLGTVEFDRVMRDFLTVLTLEDAQHRATGQLAIALARIEQAVGTEIARNKLPAPVPEPAENTD